MLKNLFAKVGLGSAAAPVALAATHAPYADAHVNFLYNLLFCDNLELFRRDNTGANAEPWWTLLAANPDERALRRLADGNDESRVRALAFNRLRAHGWEVAPKILLGVIVEVPLDRGLDVLAAYADGRVRYLNQTGKVSIFEGGPAAIETLAHELVATALPLAQRIGPWNDARLPPPRRGHVRMTLIVSDGLYFGEGDFAQLQRDPLGGPVLAKATQLLNAVVDCATPSQG